MNLAILETLLYRISAGLRCRIIDGEHGEPYLERYYLFGLWGWHVYLHRFLDSDPDLGLHDHPWGRALSLVLVGGYDEQRLVEPDVSGTQRRVLTRTVRPGQLNRLRGSDYHRVLLCAGRPAWTLFMHGPRVKGWGFLRGDGYRPMARDGTESLHRDWWRQAPRGQALRRPRRP